MWEGELDHIKTVGSGWKSERKREKKVYVCVFVFDMGTFLSKKSTISDWNQWKLLLIRGDINSKHQVWYRSSSGGYVQWSQLLHTNTVGAKVFLKWDIVAFFFTAFEGRMLNHTRMNTLTCESRYLGVTVKAM